MRAPTTSPDGHASHLRDPLRDTFSVTISPSEARILLAVPEQFLPYPI